MKREMGNKMLVRLCRGWTANDQRLGQAKRNQRRIRAQEGMGLVCEERRRLLCTSRRPRPPLSMIWREAGREREHRPEPADFPSGCGAAQEESARSCPPRRQQRARAAHASPAPPRRSCGPAPLAARLLRWSGIGPQRPARACHLQPRRWERRRHGPSQEQGTSPSPPMPP